MSQSTGNIAAAAVVLLFLLCSADGQTKQLDLQAFNRAFAQRMEKIDPATAASDPELTRLVTDHPWHVETGVKTWLDFLDPGRETKHDRQALLRAVRTMSAILARAAKAPALKQVVSRVATWTPDEWKRYREATAGYREAVGASRKRRWKDAIDGYARAGRIYRTLGRVDRVAMTLRAAAQCEIDQGRPLAAARLLDEALKMCRAIGNSITIMDVAYRLGNVKRAVGRTDEAMGHYGDALEQARGMQYRRWIAILSATAGDCLGDAGRVDESLSHYRRLTDAGLQKAAPAYACGALLNLGTLVGADNAKEGLEHLDRALALARATGDRARVALALNNAGNVLIRVRRFGQARERHAEALRIRRELANPAAIAQSLSNLGQLEAKRHRYADAVPLLLEALKNRRRTGDLGGLIELHLTLTTNYDRLGDHRAQLRSARRAIELSKRLEDPHHLVGSYVALGHALEALGQRDEALRHLELALTASSRARDPLDRGVCHNALGRFFELVGRHAEALAHLEKALAIARTARDRRGLAQGLLQLGTVNARLGRFERACQCSVGALAIYRELGDDYDAAHALFNLGEDRMRQGHIEDGLSHFLEAAGIFDRVGNERDRGIGHFGVGRALLAAKRPTDGIKHLRRAIELGEVAGDDSLVTNALNNLARACSDAGDREQALKLNERALRRARRAGIPADTVLCALCCASNYWTLGRVAEARAAASEGLTVFARLLKGLVADRERVDFLETWHRWLAPAVIIALTETPEVKPDWDLALGALEGLRGIATAGLLQGSALKRPVDGNPELVSKLRRLENRIDHCQRTLAETAGRRSIGDRQSRTRLRNEQRAFEQQWQELFSRLARDNASVGRFAEPQPLSLAALKSKLPDGTAYVAIVLHGIYSVLIVVDNDRARHWRLPGGRVIMETARRHLALLSREPKAGDEALLRTGRRLHELLVQPAARVLASYSTLIVSADGILNGLPLGTLVEPGESTSLRTAPFLVRRHTFVYAQSATVWNAGRRRAAERREREGLTSLVFGDPVGPGEASWRQAGRRFVYAKERGDLGRLPGSRREAIAVLQSTSDVGATLGEMKAWRFRVGGESIGSKERPRRFAQIPGLDPGVRDVEMQGRLVEMALGRAASKKRFVTHPGLSRCRFIHLAAHAQLNERNPGLSGIVLSPSGQDSGYLRVTDIVRLELAAGLVMLSGCSTARGKMTGGEGFLGLTRAFLFAGADNVVASAWPVPDRATSELLPDVYRAMLNADAAPAEALRKAQLAHLERVPPDEPLRASPYYWGAWMLWGVGTKNP